MARPRQELHEIEQLATKDKSSEPAVHALIDGKLPGCGFTDRTPEYWPESQTWTDWPDLDRITCSQCQKYSQDRLNEALKRRRGFVMR